MIFSLSVHQFSSPAQSTSDYRWSVLGLQHYEADMISEAYNWSNACMLLLINVVSLASPRTNERGRDLERLLSRASGNGTVPVFEGEKMALLGF